MAGIVGDGPPPRLSAPRRAKGRGAGRGRGRPRSDQIFRPAVVAILLRHSHGSRVLSAASPRCVCATRRSSCSPHIMPSPSPPGPHSVRSSASAAPTARQDASERARAARDAVHRELGRYRRAPRSRIASSRPRTPASGPRRMPSIDHCSRPLGRCPILAPTSQALRHVRAAHVRGRSPQKPPQPPSQP